MSHEGRQASRGLHSAAICGMAAACRKTGRTTTGRRINICASLQGEMQVGDEGLAPAARSPSKPKDYSFEYVAAAPKHQAFLVTDVQTLRRPASEPIAGDDDAPEQLPPVSFRLVDDQMPRMHCSCALARDDVRFQGGAPSLGAYACVPVKLGRGEVAAILAVDSLVCAAQRCAAVARAPVPLAPRAQCTPGSLLGSHSRSPHVHHIAASRAAAARHGSAHCSK